jgi:uncharacterized protein involved in outer membrane biogenesis
MSPQDSSRRQSRWGWRSLLWAVPLALLLFVVVSDLFGWAYLRKPVEAILSSKLDRKVEISPPFRIHLRRSIPLRVGGIHIAAPEWSKQPHFVAVEGLEADVDWGVLLGRRPVLHRLAVTRADIRAERDAQGRASWSMGGDKEPAKDAAPLLPVIAQLSVGQARVEIDDALNQLNLKIDARAGEAGAQASRQAGGQQTAPAPQGAGLVATGSGTWRNEPVGFELRTKGVRPLMEGGALTDLELKAKLRSTEMTFNGGVSDLATFDNIQGKVSAKGQSLGELTAIPGLTLPATPPYRLDGDVQRAGSTVKVNVTRAEIGSSSMVAQLEYDSAPATPVLRGTLNASRLVLQDLGPSIGGSTDAPSAGDKAAAGKAGDKAAAGKAADGKAAAGKSPPGKAPPAKTPAGKTGSRQEATKQGAAPASASRVLPTKEFNLPSLRQMNADVALDLQKLDLGTDALRPLSSLKARLLLENGVLRLQDLKSDLAGGTVTGSTVLDSSASDKPPVFDARLKWNRVELKNWITISGGYFVAGRFSGETLLKGAGKSTASILESLGGTIKGRIDGGSISHQIVEIAGLDVAQALGVFVSGDKALPLSCALVDLVAEKGSVRSNLFVLNTPDTIFFLQGGVNFSNEGLDLRLVQSPKDWSPLSLRSPITINGTFSDPAIGIEPAPVALKLLSSIVLGAVTPLAALLPLIEREDTGAREGCAPAIEQVKKKAAELGEKSSGKAEAAAGANAAAAAAEEGTPPKDGKAAPRPGRMAGERP